MLRQLGREAVGSFALLLCGVGATALVRHAPGWRTPVVAAGFAIGQMLAATITRGPLLRVNPAASLLSWLRDEVSGRLAVASVAVQVVTMAMTAWLVVALTGASAKAVSETSPSLLRTTLVVTGASAVWFAILVRRPPVWQFGLVYGALHLIGLPLDGGSLNPARTLAPTLLGGPASAVVAFALPPFVVATVMGMVLGPAPTDPPP